MSFRAKRGISRLRGIMTLALAALTGMALLAVAAFGFVRLREAPAQLRAFGLFIPLSQLVGLAMGFFAAATEKSVVAGGELFLFAAGLMCAVLDLIILRELRFSAQLELQQARARAADEQLLAQEAQLRWAREEEARAKAVRAQIAESLREARANLEREEPDGGRRAVQGLADAARAIERTRRICCNEAANALLELKRDECAKLGVACRMRVSLPSELGLPQLDLCSLFSNAIDNALHAAAQAQGEGRFIEVEARCDRGFLLLVVRNGMASDACEARREAGSRESRRVDGHGWGLGILETLAKRYRGRVDAAPREGIWVTSVILELP